ncbi:MAG: hypothetical protein ACOC41_09280, partial [Chitinivibrionales bacterium]
MRIAKWHITLGLLTAVSLSVSAATFTVSQDGRGQFSSVQAAINAAGKGDIVRILDEAVYAEQVTIDSSKAGLTLTSANPTSANKPTIIWQDTENVHPQTADEALDEDMINFDQNGALRMMRTRNITIDGIRVEGDGPYIFGGDGVWEAKHPLQHGNASITIWISGDVTIRNCDITNSYIGINVKDRNEGGIFANANPGDLEPWNVVPLSGFGKTGNHLFENNRIHNNSFGMFFESTWDLGSTIRYNLFYENHHETSDFAADVKSYTSEGANQPGGAIWFKDHTLSPIAIHNNTFWHNFVDFCGHWRIGAQHLVFNNIHSTPNEYWSDAEVYENPYHTMSGMFPHRMKNSIYACKGQPPSTRSQGGYQFSVQDPATNSPVFAESTHIGFDQVRISNDLSEVEIEGQEIVLTIELDGETYTETAQADWVILPGALITDPFEPEANMRWLETDYEDDDFSFKLFKSTDPDDPAFLEPDWDNPYVQEFILDAGWEEAGIRDADGSIADLGAISFAGQPSDLVTIKPLSPVIIEGTNAIVHFDLNCREGEFTNPQIKFFRFIETVEFQAESFGGDVEPVPADVIHEIPVDQPVEVGGNMFDVDVPSRGEDDLYAFFEIVIEGTGSDGETVTSTVGFLPYRKMENKLEVTILDEEGEEITEVQAGVPVTVLIEAFDGTGAHYTNIINPVEVSLNSSFPLLSGDCDIEAYQNCSEFTVPSIRRSHEDEAIFTRVPEGEEYIAATGLWINPDDNTQQLPFYGISDGITILPGEPAEIVFQDPPSNLISGGVPPNIDPGIPYEGYLEVYDRFGNRVDQVSQVQLTSLHPDIGNFVGGTQTITTDVDGVGHFTVEITNGAEDDIFTLQGAIQGMTPDQADMKVGAPRDRFWIFYGDTGA